MAVLARAILDLPASITNHFSFSLSWGFGLCALMACLGLVAWGWLGTAVQDFKHNRGRFMNSRNGFVNLLMIYRKMDRLYDFLGEMYTDHLTTYLGLSPEEVLKQSVETPDGVPNAIIQLPLFRITTLSNPRDVEHVLKHNFENYPKGDMFQFALKDLLGEGIFAVDGHMWRQQRKTASHEFTVDKFRSYYLDVFTKHTQHVLEIVAEHQGKPIEMQELFQRYTLEAIGELGFGVQLGCLDSEEPPAFAVAFDNAQAQLWRRLVLDQMTWKMGKLLGLGKEGEMKGWIRTLREFTQDVIDRRRRELRAQPDAVRSGGDILSRFMLLEVEGEPLTDQQLRDVVLNFVIAGRDTTSNALSWALHLLTEHPEVQERVRAELDGLGTEPSYEELSAKRRPLLHAVVQETLRLYPSVPLSLKHVLNDDILPDGTFVPKGSFVSFGPYLQGRSPSVWGSDCAEFKPDRWLNAEGEFQRVTHYKFPAFNAGYRLCLGMDLANLEIKTMLSLLLRQYRPSKTPGQDITYALTLTLPMKNGIRVTFDPVQ